jgi:hypothetical protein
MKTGRIAALVGMVLGGAFAVRPALAQVPFANPARAYTSWMARAMDECTSPSVTVTSPGLPTAACPQVNVATDSDLLMRYTRVAFSSRTGSVRVVGTGYQAGARVKVQMTVRVTKPNQSVLPSGTKSITFPDVTAQCPTGAFGIPVNLNGGLQGSFKLADCLPSSGLATGNIEVLDLALINVDTGEVLGHPGFVR